MEFVSPEQAWLSGLLRGVCERAPDVGCCAVDDDGSFTVLFKRGGVLLKVTVEQVEG